MIRVKKLQEVLKTAFASLKVKGEKPLSLLLIADTDSGKSRLLLTYRLPKAEIISDVTSKGLYNILTENKDCEMIVIPDFNAVVSHRPSVSNATVTALLSLMEEGMMKVSDAGGTRDMKMRKISVITAMTTGMTKAKAGKWRQLGLLRRFLPVFYTYSEETSKAIHASIRDGNYSTALIADFVKVPSEKQFVSIPKKISFEIERYSKVISRTLESRGFTAHKFLRVYTKARALLDGRRVVSKKDFEDMMEAGEFVRLDHPNEI